MGEGPMTGRGLGLCAGNDTPGSVRDIDQDVLPGRGMGRGLGRRFRHGQFRGRWGFRFRMRDNLPDQASMTEKSNSKKVKKKKNK
jgi:hypothetical protein